MPEQPLKIEGKVKDGVGVIELSYGPEEMLRVSGADLSEQLINQYEGLSQQAGNPSVVVQINADTAGSPVIRALVNLHKSVRRNQGKIACVGYPAAYMPSLSSIGVLNLPGFLIRSGQDQATAELKLATA